MTTVLILLVAILSVMLVIALTGWWSTTLIARREIRRAVMAEAKYRAVFQEFIGPA